MIRRILRIYFMAHAPAEPPQWFQPVMPEIGECPNAYKELSADDWKQWQDELPEYAPDKCSPATLAFAERHSQWQEKFRQWEIEREKQRCFQWPAAWADGLLKARQAE